MRRCELAVEEVVDTGDVYRPGYDLLVTGLSLIMMVRVLMVLFGVMRMVSM